MKNKYEFAIKKNLLHLPSIFLDVFHLFLIACDYSMIELIDRYDHPFVKFHLLDKYIF